jgi:hypothetical protein
MQATQPEPKAPRLWASIREALRGSHHDYTELNLDRAILLLAVPMVLEMSMESLFAIVDAFFVSSLGTDSVAAVALTESLVVTLYALAVGLSMATTSGEGRDIRLACFRAPRQHDRPSFQFRVKISSRWSASARHGGRCATRLSKLASWARTRSGKPVT